VEEEPISFLLIILEVYLKIWYIFKKISVIYYIIFYYIY